MIRSMTGYGTATVATDEGSLTAEVRSVNSRGLKLVTRGPPGSEGWEPDIRALVGERVRRGRVDVTFQAEAAAVGTGRALDEDRVREALRAATLLREEYGVGGELEVSDLVRMSELYRESAEGRFEPPLELVREAVSAALDGLVEMREGEGRRLETDLRERVAAIRSAVDASEALLPERLERERERLRAAVRELAEEGLDEERLAREIALVADRWDVGEELVRARAHLDAFEEYLEAPSDEPVGKRLGFLVQELQREINTLGAKANDARISRRVVEAKNEIEKLREQIENVE